MVGLASTAAHGRNPALLGGEQLAFQVVLRQTLASHRQSSDSINLRISLRSSPAHSVTHRVGSGADPPTVAVKAALPGRFAPVPADLDGIVIALPACGSGIVAAACLHPALTPMRLFLFPERGAGL